MRFLLDSTVLIDHSLARPGVHELLESLFAKTGDLYTCDIVVTEALSKGTDEEIGLIHGLVRALEYVSTHPDAAAWAGEMRRARKVTGRGSVCDAIVAGVARSLEAAIVTRNPKDFAGLGVPVIGYE